MTDRYGFTPTGVMAELSRGRCESTVLFRKTANHKDKNNAEERHQHFKMERRGAEMKLILVKA